MKWVRITATRSGAQFILVACAVMVSLAGVANAKSVSDRILSRVTVSELHDCSWSCHMYTDSSQTGIKKRRNREHRPSDGDFD